MRHLEIVKRRNLWFAISLFMLIPGLISLVLFGMKVGIDFTGGTMFELRVPPTVTAQAVKDSLKGTAIHDAMVQMSPAGSDSIALVRAKSIDNKEQVIVFQQMRAKIGEFKTERVEVVGPSVGTELLWNSIWAMTIVIGGIIAYLSMRFRYDYALCAIGAMLHDVLIIVGLFSILGKFAGMEIDSLFVTAVLTVAGFSVHDTIVVFDRIRENAKLAGPKTNKSFSDIADDSINQTVARSINTSLTVCLTLTALLIFGGESIRGFVLAMLIGIAVGTYSSIFVASPLLALWRDADTAKGRRRSVA
ncbi:MAG: protein translocase subunit SecF [Candidatus Sericytochromatia bacterium]|nr:protein translocase subunit SecF [Candidatus Sericytochromatia bacterium]